MYAVGMDVHVLDVITACTSCRPSVLDLSLLVPHRIHDCAFVRFETFDTIIVLIYSIDCNTCKA